MFFQRGLRGVHPFISVAVGKWDDLNDAQKTGLCQLIWAGTHDGEVVVIDGRTNEVISTHALQEPPGFNSQESDRGPPSA